MITTGLGSTSAGLTVTAVKDGGTMSDSIILCILVFFVLSESNNDFILGVLL